MQADRDLQPAFVAAVWRSAEIELHGEETIGHGDRCGIAAGAIECERRSNLITHRGSVEQLEDHVEAAAGRVAAVFELTLIRKCRPEWRLGEEDGPRQQQCERSDSTCEASGGFHNVHP